MSFIGKNEEDFRCFFECNYSPIVAFAYKFVLDIALSKDIAQECFLNIWNSNIDFKDKNLAKKYLFTIAKNVSLNHLKHKKVIIENVVDYNNVDNSSWELIIRNEVYSKVYEAVNTLPERSKQVINNILIGMSDKEIAEVMNISINTVRTLKKLAYKKLKAYFNKHNYGDFIVMFSFLLKK